MGEIGKNFGRTEVFCNGIGSENNKTFDMRYLGEDLINAKGMCPPVGVNMTREERRVFREAIKTIFAELAVQLSDCTLTEEQIDQMHSAIFSALDEYYGNNLEAAEKRYEMWRERVEKAWPVNGIESLLVSVAKNANETIASNFLEILDENLGDCLPEEELSYEAQHRLGKIYAAYLNGEYVPTEEELLYFRRKILETMFLKNMEEAPAWLRESTDANVRAYYDSMSQEYKEEIYDPDEGEIREKLTSLETELRLNSEELMGLYRDMVDKNMNEADFETVLDTIKKTVSFFAKITKLPYVPAVNIEWNNPDTETNLLSCTISTEVDCLEIENVVTLGSVLFRREAFAAPGQNTIINLLGNIAHEVWHIYQFYMQSVSSERWWELQRVNVQNYIACDNYEGHSKQLIEREAGEVGDLVRGIILESKRGKL